MDEPIEILQGAVSAGQDVEGEEAPSLPVNRANVVDQALHETESTVHLSFVVRYARITSEVRLAEGERVSDLKALLYSLTDVPPERQKILGLVRGKLPSDETILGELLFPAASLRDSPNPVTREKRVNITLVGTPVDQTFKDPTIAEASKDVRSKGSKGSKVLDDINYADERHLQVIANHPLREEERSIKSLNKAIERYSRTFHVINAPRRNLKGGLLVLDLDYTIANTKRLLNYRVHAREAERPGLHELLEAVYPYYDICVWSQTSLFWLEAKLTELGCLTNPRYNISFVLDQTPMFHVYPRFRIPPQNRSNGGMLANTPDSAGWEVVTGKHRVKALEIIWRRFPEYYNSSNTIHVDDLARNFALNPGNGLKIDVFRLPKRDVEMETAINGRPLATPEDDRELFHLQKYLLQLAHPSVTNFCSPNGHKNWKEFSGPSILDREDGEQGTDS